MSEVSAADPQPSDERSRPVDAGPKEADRQAHVDRVVEHVMRLAEVPHPHAPSSLAQELSYGQMRLLLWLEREGPATMSRIAESLGVGLPTASGIVERLERHGVVVREHRSDDRRIVKCRLTDEGRAIVSEVTGRQVQAIRQLAGLLTDDELEQLDRIVLAVADRLESRTA